MKQGVLSLQHVVTSCDAKLEKVRLEYQKRSKTDLA